MKRKFQFLKKNYYILKERKIFKHRKTFFVTQLLNVP